MSAKILPFPRPEKASTHPVVFMAANYVIGIAMIALLGLAWIKMFSDGRG